MRGMVQFNTARGLDSSVMVFGSMGEVATSRACTKKPHAGEGAGLRFLPRCGLKPCSGLLLLGGRALFLDCSLRGGEAGDWHAVRRAGHVGQTDLMAELNGIGVAAVFATDA